MVFGHTTVLLHEAIEFLALKDDDVVVDATLGGAGHSALIAQKLSKSGMLIGIDADREAIARGEHMLASVAPRVVLLEGNFRNMRQLLAQNGITQITKILFDLGWSGFQLTANRGFSFLADEPLAMTYAAESTGLTAEKIVNTWEESSLADVIWGWGEERYAKRIAQAIVERREKQPFLKSRDLAEVVKNSVPASYRFGRLHPATKTFQALRIAVNDELGALETGLSDAWGMLPVGGRIAVITFHSIEDRLVKQWMKARKDGRLIEKKVVTPSEQEILENPRSRSAKLRGIEKISV
ncbi:16S rRNA (cytosine(1402)-N(4))-methyltransferase RsmH [bacterium]|nr:16S rRNA (cytosine(1402)-N(4))-methyltransferase RsmH [bacterium]